MIRTKSEKASLNSETCSSVSESACSDGQVSYHTGVPAAVRGKRKEGLLCASVSSAAGYSILCACRDSPYHSERM